MLLASVYQDFLLSEDCAPIVAELLATQSTFPIKIGASVESRRLQHLWFWF